jgi:hypothetical protein
VSNGVPRLQWRDRAGFSPDFPIKPSRAPENIKEVTQGRGEVNPERGNGNCEARGQHASAADQEAGSTDVGVVTRGRIGLITQPDIGD